MPKGFTTCFLLLFQLWFLISCNEEPNQTEKPNILWIVSEDNSPLVGAYGDEFATTPNIDRLAENGFLYTHAYANAPVCAPARNTIITGTFANSNGNQHMRSDYEVSDVIEFFPALLREAGYYATNNAKEDYNIDESQTEGIWDESSGEAHYDNREPGQPFFAVFNSHISHENNIHNWKPLDELRHLPDDVDLPPYLPDTPEIRRDFAQYYDLMEDMDGWVGEKISELEESGELENTIIFYYGDHGGVYPRSKRFVYETGTRVPLIVSIPEKFEHLWPSDAPGTDVDRLVSFVDLAPTILSLAGVEIPEFMQGHAFLGEQKTPDPEYAFMFRDRMDERYDMSRTVRNDRFRYIRNFTPHRIYGQPIEYLWRAAAMQSWEETCAAGGCNEVQNKFWETKPAEELYDTQNDPWEVNNLADDPDYQNILVELRQANRDWMAEIKDTGFLPEIEMISRANGMSPYDYMRSGDIDLERVMEAAETATSPKEDDLSTLRDFLISDDSAIRFWGATGLINLGEDSRPALDDLRRALDDSSPYVTTAAAEALYGLGEESAALEGFNNVLQHSNSLIRTFALNAITSLGEDSDEFKEVILEMVKAHQVMAYSNYDHRITGMLFEDWGIDPEEHGVEIDWSIF